MERIELRYNHEFIYVVELSEDKEPALAISVINTKYVGQTFSVEEIDAVRNGVITACESMIKTIKNKKEEELNDKETEK